MGLREWFDQLSPIQQDIVLAGAAGLYGVVITWGIVKYLRDGDKRPLQAVGIATSVLAFLL